MIARYLARSAGLTALLYELLLASGGERGTVILAATGLMFLPEVTRVHVKRVVPELPEARQMKWEDEEIERQKEKYVKGDIDLEQFERMVQTVMDRRPTDDTTEAKVEARERRRHNRDEHDKLILAMKEQHEEVKRKLTHQHVLDDLARAYAVPSHMMGTRMPCPKCSGRIHPMDEPYPVERLGCHECGGQGYVHPTFGALLEEKYQGA
jgi:hypothetical protein